jgi:RNA polymerase sigma factor (sigma-70 family)
MSSEWDERFHRLIQHHGAALRRLAQAYARDTADGDDLFQDICFAVWRALPSFRGESSERTFVFRIGHNRGLTHRSRRKESAPLGEDLADRSPGPESLAVAAIRRESLLAAVRRLPEAQRQVVTMSLEGMTPAEIAEVLGTTPNSIAIRLTRARQALRALLNGEGEPR